MPNEFNFESLGQSTINVGQTILQALTDVVYYFIAWLPNIIGALLILIIGILVARFVRRLIRRGLGVIKLEATANRIGITPMMQNAGLTMSISDAVLWIIYWAVLLVFISAAATTLAIPSVTQFINLLVGYIPNIFAGLIILLIGAVAANALGELFGRIAYGAAYRHIVRWLVLIIAFITALEQLGFNIDFLTNNLTIVVAGATLAVALAFGLGGKDKAREIVDRYVQFK